MKDWKRVITAFGYVLGFLWTIVILGMLLVAYQNGDWRVVVDFNHFGEGYAEMVLYSVTLVLLLIFLPMVVKWADKGE